MECTSRTAPRNLARRWRLRNSGMSSIRKYRADSSRGAGVAARIVVIDADGALFAGTQMAKEVSTRPVWLDRFPALIPAWADDGCRHRLENAQLMRLAKGSRVFEEGMPCQRYLLVLEGSIRVQKVTPGGHEIVLYHVGAGQACHLTTACIIGSHRYPAGAIAETEVRALSLPRSHFDELVNDCPPFRDFVYRHVERGITELVSLVEEVAFGHMDSRLAQCLLRQAEESVVVLTHQEVAAELGSVREVVSRLLKKFERQKWVRLHRGRIDIVNHDALREIAEKTFA